MSELRRLWFGEMPLGRTFWGYAVVGGIAVNLVTSLLFLGLLVAEWPLTAVAIGYGVSIPYNLVVLVGVWRAAGRYDGDRTHADLARIVTVIGMILLTVT